MKKIILSLSLFLLLLVGIFTFSNQAKVYSMSVRNFVYLLINLGAIPAEKLPAINVFFDFLPLYDDTKATTTLPYTLTYTANNHGTISGTPIQFIMSGASGTEVEAIPDEDYRFAKWSDGLTDNPRIDTNITADKTINATFSPIPRGGSGYTAPAPEAPITYTVVYDARGGTPAFSTTTGILLNATTSLPTEPTKDYYTFSGWYTEIDGGGTAFDETTPVTGDITVYGYWVDACDASDNATDPDCWSTTAISTFAWGPLGVTTGVQSTTDGRGNTLALVALGGYPAAEYCDGLDEGGHTDWYLPAKNQLVDGSTEYKTQYNIGNITWGGFVANRYYWSSTESDNSSYSDDYAWDTGYSATANYVGSALDEKNWAGKYVHCLR